MMKWIMHEKNVALPCCGSVFTGPVRVTIGAKVLDIALIEKE